MNQFVLVLSTKICHGWIKFMGTYQVRILAGLRYLKTSILLSLNEIEISRMSVK